MAEYSNVGAPPPPPPMMGLHTGRIPSFKNNHGDNFQNKCGAEPPACVQNAMMTKDKKPFTYTPGGLDLSQIRTPSMARKLNKQQQQMEEQDNNNYAQYRPPNMNGGGPGYSAPPPPPPPSSGPPPPPPPPPLVISVDKPVKPVTDGERPEIVIPDNPISMLRKTHSPYHWESEMADRLTQGPVPKFLEKSPSPIQPPRARPPPQQFSQRPPQQSPQPQQQPQYQINNKSPSTSPIWKPEPKYPQNNTPNTQSPQMYYQPPSAGSTPSNEMFTHQNFQYNNSTPSPWGNDSTSSTTTTTTSSTQSFTPTTESSSVKSPTPISSPMSPWRQEVRNSPLNSPLPQSNQEVRNSPIRNIVSPMASMNIDRNQVQSPPTHPPFYHRQESQQQNVPPWRLQNQIVNNNNAQSPGIASPQNHVNQQQPIQYNEPSPEVRYQTHMTIPVTPRKAKHPNDQGTPVQMNNEPVFPVKINETQKENLPWVRGDNNINKSAPPPPWCHKSMERRSISRDQEQSPEKSSPVQPAWVQRAPENRRSVPKEFASPQNTEVQPPWVTQNRGYETLPRAQSEKVSSMPSSNNQIFQHTNGQSRIIPIQIETEQGQSQASMQGKGQKQPQLRIIIDMNQQGQPPLVTQVTTPQGNNVPQHRIRMIQPQIVRMDGASLSTPPIKEQHNNQPSYQQQQLLQQQNQPKTRIIPIQMEPSSPVLTSPRVIYHRTNSETPPRQSKSFRVLQVITGTSREEKEPDYDNMGYTDL